MKGIYKITNLINNKVYIGQTYRLNEREREHLYRLERNEHHNEYLQKSYNKYGKDNFKFEIIELTGDLDDRELYWLNEYGGLNSNNTYNFKDPKTKKWSEYTKVKQSKSMLGENNPNFGKKWTDEQKEKASKSKKGKKLEDLIGEERAKLAKEKMSKSQKGRKHPEEVKEKIRQANIGENNPAYGMGDRQRGENNPMWGKPCNSRQPIQCFTKEGILVKEYDFISQVKEDGFGPSNVMYCARGAKNYKSVGGFIWKFKE
jgi:group I intron endonuclease